MTIQYSTIIEVKENGKWSFFSQQAWKQAQYPYEAGETPMTDAQYLDVCKQIEPDKEIRISPKQGYTVTAGTLYDPYEDFDSGRYQKLGRPWMTTVFHVSQTDPDTPHTPAVQEAN